MIHPTAILSPEVALDGEVEIGAYSVLEGNVRIGSGTVISSGVRIEGDTEIGRDNRIFTGAVLGSAPQHVAYRGEQTALKIGNGNIIREYVTIHRGTGLGGGITRVGDENFIMAYTHIAHDCRMGSRITMANMVQLSGHVVVDDEAVFSGFVGVHQFVRIGSLAMAGGGAMIVQDVPPYAMVIGDRARLYGINRVGLERKGLAPEVIRNIREAYQILFRSGLPRDEAFRAVRERFPSSGPGGAEVEHIIEFIQQSQRGVVRYHSPRETPPVTSEDGE